MPKGHYKRGRSLEVRFWSFAEIGDGCWEWTGYRIPTGYGTFCLKAHTTVYAHRLAYELTHGPIPAGLEIDHLCRNRGCVRPGETATDVHEEGARMKPVTKPFATKNPDGMTVADLTFLTDLASDLPFIAIPLPPGEAPEERCSECPGLATVAYLSDFYCSEHALSLLGALPSLAHSAFASRVSV